MPDITDDGDDDDNIPPSTMTSSRAPGLYWNIISGPGEGQQHCGISTYPAKQPTGPPTATPLDSEDPQITFQWTVVGVQRELADQVRAGMETLAATLEGVHGCRRSSRDNSAAIRGTYSLLHGP